MPDTTTDSAHGERSSEVVKDDIRAVVSCVLPIGESPAQRYGADLEGGCDSWRRSVTNTNTASRFVPCSSFARRHRWRCRRHPLRIVWQAPLGIGGMSDDLLRSSPQPPQRSAGLHFTNCRHARNRILTTGRGCGRRETCWARVWGRWKGRRWKKVEHWGGCPFLCSRCGLEANGTTRSRLYCPVLRTGSCRYRRGAAVGCCKSMRVGWRNVENAMMSRSAARKDRTESALPCLRTAEVAAYAGRTLGERHAVPGRTTASPQQI